MDETQLVALLGRPLTVVEQANTEAYINIATQTLEQLTCLDLTNSDDSRIYDTRGGYRTLFTDLFTDIIEVKIDGNVTSDYSVRQWNRRSGDWYNSLVFKSELDREQEVEVQADWIQAGCLPNDLAQVLAGLFSLVTTKNKFDSTVTSKQVEDFRVTLKSEADIDADFQKKFGTILTKYSQCNIANIQHGGVC